MDIRPIRTETGHAVAFCKIERLLDAPEGSDEAARLEVLAILVEDCEKRFWPASKFSPPEILRYATTGTGRSQKQLAELLGSRSRASELLSGKRRLTVEAVHQISTAWHIPAQLLIGPHERKQAA